MDKTTLEEILFSFYKQAHQAMFLTLSQFYLHGGKKLLLQACDNQQFINIKSLNKTFE